MTYTEALDIVQKNQNLIGTINDKGFKIDELIIVPTNPIYQRDYILSFLHSGSTEKAISPYLSEDLEVWAIDKNHLFNANILFYDTVTK